MDTEYTPSEHQTKEWRKGQNWYTPGVRKNQCEIQQKKWIEKIIGKATGKTQDRIHKHTGLIVNKKIDIKWTYTENFDIKTKIGDKTLYFNLKFVCEGGGAQARTFSLVYDFIKLQQGCDKSIFFINILDGNYSSKFVNEIKDLSRANIYIGDTYSFVDWFNKTFQ